MELSAGNSTGSEKIEPARGHPDRPLEFRAAVPWLGPDLQTIRNFIVRPRPARVRRPDAAYWFDMSDGTGDRLHGALNLPDDGDAARRVGAPLVILIHGLTGCSESFYVLKSADALLSRGFPVLRVDLRAAGPGLGRCVEQYHAGRTEDLRRVLDLIDATLPGEVASRPRVAVGYSLGGNMLLKYLGEVGKQPGLVAAASVSAPLDLAQAGAAIRRPRNWVYQRYLLRRMKLDAFETKGGLDPAHQAAVRAARTVYEFDDRYIAPRFGFGDANTYYAECSAERFAGAIRIPTLIIHSLDDPWIPADPYRRLPWSANDKLIPAIFKGGGHVGFHSGGEAANAAHDRRLLAFLEPLGN